MPKRRKKLQSRKHKEETEPKPKTATSKKAWNLHKKNTRNHPSDQGETTTACHGTVQCSTDRHAFGPMVSPQSCRSWNLGIWLDVTTTNK